MCCHANCAGVDRVRVNCLSVLATTPTIKHCTSLFPIFCLSFPKRSTYTEENTLCVCVCLFNGPIRQWNKNSPIWTPRVLLLASMRWPGQSESSSQKAIVIGWASSSCLANTVSCFSVPLRSLSLSPALQTARVFHTGS